MTDWRTGGIEWFEENFKRLRGKGLVPALFHFGYCPKCDDITEIRYWNGDDWARPPIFYTQCMKCETTYTSRGGCGGLSRDGETIGVTGDQIPPKFRKKWDRMHSKTQQRRLLKEKARDFLRKLQEDRQRIEDICKDASQRLGKFVS